MVNLCTICYESEVMSTLVFRALLHDEETYPNPFQFNPERFLDEKGQIDSSVPHPETVCFGFGRR